VGAPATGALAAANGNEVELCGSSGRNIGSDTTATDRSSHFADLWPPSLISLFVMSPQTGELRLRSPQPPTPWNTTLDTRGIPPSCPQLKIDGDLMLGSEDCLTLRVWRPSDMAPGEVLPVMFWIYGGGEPACKQGSVAQSTAGRHREA